MGFALTPPCIPEIAGVQSAHTACWSSAPHKPQVPAAQTGCRSLPFPSEEALSLLDLDQLKGRRQLQQRVQCTQEAAATPDLGSCCGPTDEEVAGVQAEERA